MKPKRNRTPRQKKTAENALYEAVFSLRTPQECRQFFEDLCTPAELQALVDRWQVVAYLQKEIPYRKIQELTGVSVTTIGRVARSLAAGSGGYRTAIQRTQKSTNRATH